MASATAVASEPVAESPHSLQRPQAERAVDLLAEIADIDLDHIGSVVMADVPGRIEQLTVTEYLAGASHERLEQGELTGGQPNLLVSAPDLCRGRVESQWSAL